MIHSDDAQTLNRADINTLNTAVLTLARVIESQQTLIEILDDRVTLLERRLSKPRWWRKRV